MVHLGLEQINEIFDTEMEGEEIGYGEKGVKFEEVKCKNLEDFHVNAEMGQCWTDEKEITYYKIRNQYGEAEAFVIDENGEIELL